jgi:hypothetical protein
LKTILKILLLFFLPTLTHGQELQEFHVQLPDSQLEEHNIVMTFRNPINLTSVEFDRWIEGLVWITINNAPEPQIINSGQDEQTFWFDANVKVHSIKIKYQTNHDTWLNFKLKNE